MILPKYKQGQLVWILKAGELKCVEILRTSIVVEEDEVYYNVQNYNDEVKKEFIIDENDVLNGVGNTPVPAFQIGEIVSFTHKSPEGDDIFTGAIEEIIIKYDEDGYYVFYKTDEHQDGDCVSEDDIVDVDLDLSEEDLNDTAAV